MMAAFFTACIDPEALSHIRPKMRYYAATVTPAQAPLKLKLDLVCVQEKLRVLFCLSLWSASR